MSLPTRICLCGYMGAGKTTTGRLLAERLQYRFVDLDMFIEERQQRSIAEIFATDGETYFRRLEVDTGLEVLRTERVVIALGGGALTSEVLRSAVSVDAFLVFLKASVATLCQRAHSARARPLLAHVNGPDDFQRTFDAHMRARAPHYEQAQLIISTDGLTVAQTVDSIMCSLQESERHAR